MTRTYHSVHHVLLLLLLLLVVSVILLLHLTLLVMMHLLLLLLLLVMLLLRVKMSLLRMILLLLMLHVFTINRNRIRICVVAHHSLLHVRGLVVSVVIESTTHVTLKVMLVLVVCGGAIHAIPRCHGGAMCAPCHGAHHATHTRDTHHRPSSGHGSHHTIDLHLRWHVTWHATTAATPTSLWHHVTRTSGSRGHSTTATTRHAILC